jgi:hypothetical protein
MTKLNLIQNRTQKHISDLFWEYDRMSSSGQFALDSLAVLHNMETNSQLEERMSKMTKEEMKQELENL